MPMVEVAAKHLPNNQIIVDDGLPAQTADTYRAAGLDLVIAERAAGSRV